MRKNFTDEQIIDMLLKNFALDHQIYDVKSQIEECGCRSGKGEITVRSWAMELSQACKYLRETFENAIDETEMMLVMGEWEVQSQEPQIDDSWVQFCGGKL